eukprot:3630337-Amphidinium_carterae.2
MRHYIPQRKINVRGRPMSWLASSHQRQRGEKIVNHQTAVSILSSSPSRIPAAGTINMCQYTAGVQQHVQ